MADEQTVVSEVEAKPARARVKADLPDDTFDGSDGRRYRRTDRGVFEVDDPSLHALRMLKQMTTKHTITGVRIVNPADPDGPAIVVTMNSKEAKPIVEAIRVMLDGRI